MLIPPPIFRSRTLGSLLLSVLGTVSVAQMALPPPGPLDPASGAHLRPAPLSQERAEFIWTANDAAAHDPALQARVRGQEDKTAPHFFRVHFHLKRLPPAATLYLAGPRAVTMYLNGREVLRATDDGTRPKNLSVLSADVSAALRAGDNVLALSVVRGHSSLHTGASATINQITYGEVLAAKIVPAPPGVDKPSLLHSDTQWRSTLRAAAGWEQPAFDDRSWPAVESLGILGSRRDFLQWNADAGLYAWPGYSGIGTALRVFQLRPVTARASEEGGTLVDFGREIQGRVRLRSHAPVATTVQVSYGESPEEALRGKSYLGTRTILVPAFGVGFGPKSGFRYLRLTPSQPSPHEQIDVDAQVITYPVTYHGSFYSSDTELNRIFETAAYTARLCMQEGVWDGIKRDRGRWMGDLDVTGRTIMAVFGSAQANAMVAQTMAEIIGSPPVTRDVNTIAGYSALWITGQANLYRHTGDLASLRKAEPALLSLLALMDTELDPNGLFTNPGHHKVFVDWSDDLSSDTAEARAATHFQFAAAYADAAFLLRELGDDVQATRMRLQASRLRDAAQASLLTPGTKSFGTRWQTNAFAVLSDVPNAEQKAAIWDHVLSHVGEQGATITPFCGYYVLRAMAALNHRPEALRWMHTYWGGMLAEGASSFWESYDPHWPRDDFHAHLEADNKRGYYVSLAHGWASGPAPWLLEQILGIEPTTGGFREVTLRPDLAGLAFARGSEPTPRGPLEVSLRTDELTIRLPPGTRATVQLPFLAHFLNGHPLEASTRAPDGRLQVVLQQAGTFRFTTTSDASLSHKHTP